MNGFVVVLVRVTCHGATKGAVNAEAGEVTIDGNLQNAALL